MGYCSFRPVLLALWLSVIAVFAYIPALPTNSTESAIAGGLNVTDVSKLHLQWYSNGSYWENVSYQLAGFQSQGISKGALVHFSEGKFGNQTTTTPWIALVACDTNGTSYSMMDDIFTLARDGGAVAALLYSLYSNACIINPAYSDPANFDQVFDIFSTQSLTSALLIEYQFGQFGAQNESIYGSYNPSTLNDSAAIINQSISTGFPMAPGYLIATLQAYNATGNDTGVGTGGANNNPNTQGSSNTGLAMIILYAITGCVSALFCVVIITGAIRAVRHPERYGPRAVGVNGGGFGTMGESRARGITRAILETFPVVKFGGASEDRGTITPRSTRKDLEDNSELDPSAAAMEMTEWHVVDQPTPDGQNTPAGEADGRKSGEQHDGDELHGQAHASTSQTTGESPLPQARPRSLQNRGSPPDADEVVPAAIGYATCPICIVDFEEGDDLRVLPCEGKHRFHQSCVDPWLLELSSSCPICRQDFQALESILSGGSEDDHNRTSYLQTPAVQGSRFSRYLRFARKRRHEQPAENYDPGTHEA